ncbi:MAG: GTPase HflX [Patescibacteria group bacterium]
MARERAVLVGVDWTGPGGRVEKCDLDELASLADTAGAEAVARVAQRRDRPDPAYFLGYGKAREAAETAREAGADLIICDEELSPAQLRNLEEMAGIKVIDRTGLILDIFAQRARTREAKLQVELAQLDYLLPRLAGRGTELSRLGGGIRGGIGTRGPGESKLEIDRRRIRRRMVELRRELAEVKDQRELMRGPRARARVPVAALVGYTNAGKSTLFNALTAGGVLVMDKLFATLDPTLRRIELPDRREAVLADTVGFIRKLPHQLVAAFGATLEEVVQADLLVHVVDGGAPDPEARAAAVRGVIASLGAGERPSLTVLNKADLLDAETLAMRLCELPGALPVSARTGLGLDALREEIAREFTRNRRLVRLLLPLDAGGLLAGLHRGGAVRSERYTTEGIEILAELDPAAAGRYREYEARDEASPAAGTGTLSSPIEP